jgi:branched-chain amino acid transport system permease protein
MTSRGLLSYWMILPFAFLVVYPFLPDANANRGMQFVALMVFGILTLGLNVVVGYTGLLHLGIAAYFGIGAYITGILTVPMFPFEYSFLPVFLLSAFGATVLGVLTTAPTLRLRGDYLALVTLGFGLITTYAIRNLDNITDGTKGLNPITPKLLPWIDDPDLSKYRDYGTGWGRRWYDYPYFYFLCLGFLALVTILLGNIERSRLGRAWVALREDELASACMGLNPARLKLAAIALGAGLAGAAGSLWAVSLKTTGNPQTFDFNTSMIALCCLILGGLGNRPGVLVGVALLMGFDRILAPMLDTEVQKESIQSLFPEWMRGKTYLKVSGWKLILFGMVLILMMRLRPEGLLPAARVKRELHPEKEP